MGESAHRLVMSERKQLELSAVSEVISFDEFSVLLYSTCGKMEIEGENLHIAALDLSSGQVKIEGKINGIYYSDETEKSERSGFFGRVFSSR